MTCPECGRLTEELWLGMCQPCLILLNDLDGATDADWELATDPRYYQ